MASFCLSVCFIVFPFKMLFYVFTSIILFTTILIAGIKYFNVKSEKNRERVRKHREKRKIKLIYEGLVKQSIAAKNRKNDEENPTSESEYEHAESNSHSEQMLVSELRNWSINNRITAKAMNELLAILRFVGFTFLPKDSRTIMETPKKIKIDNLTNGRMWYNGIEKCLENIRSIGTFNCVLTLDWNFDGLPVFKSSNLQFWPMLASIQGIAVIFK